MAYRISLILVPFLMLFCVLSSSAVDDEDLVLYLKFEEGAGGEAQDLSGNDNHGAVNGDIQWVNGKSGKGLEFGGDTTQFVEVLDSESLQFDNKPFTYMAWIKTYELNSANYQLIMSKRVPTAGDGMETASLFIRKESEFLFVEFRDSEQGMFGVDATDAIISENEWHHVAWVKDDDELNFFIDGELAQSVEHDRKGNVNGTQSLYIGVHRYGDTWNSPFIGIIDEVAVFRAALSESDIKSRMENAFAVQSFGKLITEWGNIKK